jgi:hypothetical protein
MTVKLGNTVHEKISADLPPAEYLRRNSQNKDRFEELKQLEKAAAQTTKSPVLQKVFVALALLALSGGSLNILFTG